MKNAELLDAELQSYASVSITMGLGLCLFGAAFLDGQAWVAAASEALGLTLIVAGGGALFSARAFDVAAGAWAVILGLALWRSEAWLAAVLPALVIVSVLLRRRPLRARLRGDPSALGFSPPPQLDLLHCQVCQGPAEGLIAPRVTVSWGFGAAMLHLGFRVLCLHHARLYALPATVISALVGWWSIFGLFWTPMAIYDNTMHGGVHADDETVEDVERSTRLGWRASLPALAGIGGLVFGLLEGAYVASRLSTMLGS